MTQPIQTQPIHSAAPPYRAAVEEFYRTKKGSLPTLEEAWSYLDEEYSEADLEIESFLIVFGGGDCKTGCEECAASEIIARSDVAKELADVLFTLYGVAIAANIDLDEAFRLVAASNMTKERTTEGKVRKGEGYIAPSMETALL